MKGICNTLLLFSFLLASIGSSAGADLTKEFLWDTQSSRSRLQPLIVGKSESAVQAAILFSTAKVLRFYKISAEESAVVALNKWSEEAASRIAEQKGDRNLVIAKAMVGISVLEETLADRIARERIKVLTQSHIEKFCDWLPPHSWPFCD